MRRFPVVGVVLLVFLGVLQARSALAQSAVTESARKVVTKIIPPYPAMARSMNLAGTVKLEALVLANGTVKTIQVKGGNPLLAQSAQIAVREWRWEKSDHDSTELLEFRFNP